MTSEYKKIPIKSEPAQSIEVSLEDITDDIVKDEQEQEVQEPKPELKTKKDSKLEFEQDDEEKEVKRRSRAKDRIKQLHSRTQELEEQLALEKQERINLQKQFITDSQSTRESQKSTLESQVTLLGKKISDAIKAGEAEETVKLQDELWDAKAALAGLNAQLTELKSIKKEEPPEQNRQQRQQIPSQALDWISEHPQFDPKSKLFDSLFNTVAMVVNNQLINEGHDPNTDEFYEELSERLSPRFPEVFGMSKKTGVEYTQNKTNASSENEDEYEEVKQPVRIVEQTVSGSSRANPNSSKKTANKDTVTLSEADLAQAERWGLTPRQVARRIRHSEQNKKDGYVPIIIKGNK